MNKVNVKPIDHPDMAVYVYSKIAKLTSQTRVSAWLVSELLNFSIMFIHLSESKNDNCNDYRCMKELYMFMQRSLSERRLGALINFGSSGRSDRTCSSRNCKCLHNACKSSCYFEFDATEKHIITKSKSKKTRITEGHPLVKMIDDVCDIFISLTKDCMETKSVYEIYKYINKNITKGYYSNLMLWYIAFVEKHFYTKYNYAHRTALLDEVLDAFKEHNDNNSKEKLKLYRFDSYLRNWDDIRKKMKNNTNGNPSNLENCDDLINVDEQNFLISRCDLYFS